jgi:hypothetical protein
MHVLLSVLVGCYLMATIQAVWGDRNLQTGVVFAPPDVPFLLRFYMTSMGVIALANFAYDLYKWLTFDKEKSALRLEKA